MRLGLEFRISSNLVFLLFNKCYFGDYFFECYVFSRQAKSVTYVSPLGKLPERICQRIVFPNWCNCCRR